MQKVYLVCIISIDFFGFKKYIDMKNIMPYFILIKNNNNIFHKWYTKIGIKNEKNNNRVLNVDSYD